jgi:hypothetical protein
VVAAARLAGVAAVEAGQLAAEAEVEPAREADVVLQEERGGVAEVGMAVLPEVLVELLLASRRPCERTRRWYP